MRSCSWAISLCPQRRSRLAHGEDGPVAGGGSSERGGRANARPLAVSAPAPRRIASERVDLARFIPTWRSLVTAILIVLGAGLAWFAARETPVFSVKTIEVAGAPVRVSSQVKRSLRATQGTSLLKFDADTTLRTILALPTVANARFDRAFPHTLRVVIVPEKAVAVVRQGADSYLMAESGRIMAMAERRSRPALARIWIKRDVQLQVGSRAEGDLLTAVTAVSPLVGSNFPGRVSSVTATPTSLTLRLRSGLEVRLGDPLDVALKLAVAARVIPLLTSDTAYLDVAVPERPVSGTLDSQVEPEGLTSTQP